MKLLITTDKYYPMPLANAICAQNVAEALIKKGHSVDILCFKDSGVNAPDNYNGVRVFTVKPDLRVRMFYYARNFQNKPISKYITLAASILSKAKKFLLLPLSPMSSVYFPYKIAGRMEKLNAENSYDGVITVYAPFDCALAGLIFKKRNPNVKWAIYALDTFREDRADMIPKSMRCENRWVPKLLKNTNLLIAMASRKSDYDRDDYRDYRDKIVYSDIPFCTEYPEVEMEKENREDEESWLYAGGFGAPHYKYEGMINSFLALPENKKRVLHIYSGGGDYEAFKKSPDKYNGKIVCHDYVPHDELVRLMSNSEVLVSMKSTNQISAKIFEYMSLDIPIIHFSGIRGDVNTEYLKKYDKAVIVETFTDKPNLTPDEIANKLERAINLPKSDKKVSGIFAMNTPEYTAELITKCLILSAPEGRRDI